MNKNGFCYPFIVGIVFMLSRTSCKAWIFLSKAFSLKAYMPFITWNAAPSWVI
jgi:hypothetical protein